VKDSVIGILLPQGRIILFAEFDRPCTSGCQPFVMADLFHCPQNNYGSNRVVSGAYCKVFKNTMVKNTAYSENMQQCPLNQIFIEGSNTSL